MSVKLRQTSLSLYRQLFRYGQSLRLTDKDFFIARVKKEFRSRDLASPQDIQRAHDSARRILEKKVYV